MKISRIAYLQKLGRYLKIIKLYFWLHRLRFK